LPQSPAHIMLLCNKHCQLNLLDMHARGSFMSAVALVDSEHRFTFDLQLIFGLLTSRLWDLGFEMSLERRWETVNGAI